MLIKIKENEERVIFLEANYMLRECEEIDFIIENGTTIKFSLESVEYAKIVDPINETIYRKEI